jgi:hypothetical protein
MNTLKTKQKDSGLKLEMNFDEAVRRVSQIKPAKLKKNAKPKK